MIRANCRPQLLLLNCAEHIAARSQFIVIGMTQRSSEL